MWLFLSFALAQQPADTGLDVDPCEASCYGEGQCTRKAGGVCVATADDCKASWGCEREGRCTEREGVCVMGAGDCAGTGVCEQDGRCVEGEGRCVVGSAADCAGSEDCKRDGSCGLVDGLCDATEPAHCAASEACADDGKCELVDGQCRTTPASCASSEACRERGRCTSEGYTCSVGSEADCRSSLACTRDGECTLDGQMCRASKMADCKASTHCAELGDCSFLPSSYPEPEPPPEGSDEDAGILGVLAASGSLLGGEGHGPMCGPASDADCAASEACRTKGHCTVHDNEGGGGLLGPGGPSCDPNAGSLFGSAGLGDIEMSGIGGLIGVGSYGDMGMGGLGSRGSGLGGGGSFAGIGGLGSAGVSEPEPRLDPIRITGGRKPRPVRQALREVKPKVRACTQAEVSVAFDVNDKGKLSLVEVRSGADGKQATCVVKAVQKAKLGAGPAGSATWTVRAAKD